MKRSAPSQQSRLPLGPRAILLLSLISNRDDSSEFATPEWLHEELRNRYLEPSDYEPFLALLRKNLLVESADLRLTADGRRALAQARGSVPQSVRLPADILRDVVELESAEDLSRSEMLVQLLRESTRVRVFPEIEFRGSPRDRREYVRKTRLSPWFVRVALSQHGGDVAKLQENYPHLTTNQIRQADAYARRYEHETPSEPAPPPWIERVNLA